MASPVQWTIDKVFTVLRDVQAGAAAARATTISNRGRVNAIVRSFQTQIGPPMPGAETEIRKALARQQRIEEAFQVFGGKVAELSKRAQEFLRAHGVDPSSGLSGLGLAPILVGAVIVGITLVVLKGLAWLEQANSAQTHWATATEKVLGLQARGLATPAEVAQVIAAAQHEADRAMPQSDPLGLANLATALVPIGILAVVLVFGPMVVQAMQRRGYRNPPRLRRRYARARRRHYVRAFA